MNDQALYKSKFDNCPLTFALNLSTESGDYLLFGQ